MTLRVLYNINDMKSRGAYIQVGNVANRWAESKPFIFDDTLFHQSLNETDEIRYCLFVDIVRPSLWPRLTDMAVAGVRLLMIPVNNIFYRNWTPVR